MADDKAVGRRLPAGKRCTQCGEYKSSNEYNHHRYHRGGWRLQSKCKECQRENRIEWERNNPEANRAIHRRARLRSKYSLTEEEYDILVVVQGGVCDICHRPESSRNSLGEIKVLTVDHDHTRTGRESVRSLLCANCNSAIGSFKDSPEIMRKAIAYLEKHQQSLPQPHPDALPHNLENIS